MFARLVAVLLLVLGVSALVALPGGAVSSPPTSAKVRVGDNFFKATKVTIVAGGKVKWVWEGSALHDVTVKSGPKKFHSKKQVDGKYSKVLNTTGKYKIYCTLHPGMQMTITVKPAPVTTTTAYPPAT